VSFKFKHHKHVFTGTVVGLEDTELPGGAALRALVVCSPTRMHRMQRRAFLRADVPPNRVVRASFWLGGRDAEPAGTSPDCPVWSGRVTNISAGGFQVISSDQGARCLEVGETVGVRIHFGVGEEAVYADAQFRHVQEAEGKLYVGFQFVGLAQTPEGRKTLELISVKAGQFHRESGGAERPRP
jgi:c-di-GMP-binding flagellar brake protein YcgR